MPARPGNLVSPDVAPGRIVVNIARAAVELQVYSWEQARRISRNLHGWVFRGQSSARQGLTSSIERAAKRAGVERRLLRGYVEHLLNEFQQRAHHYLAALPPATATLEWLALLQHPVTEFLVCLRADRKCGNPRAKPTDWKALSAF
jgi:hypothetical protein